MPIEIKELIIRTTVTNQESPHNGIPPDPKEWSGEIVAECVDQVMQLLKDKEKR